MGHTTPAMLKAVLLCAIVASAAAAGGLNISSLSVNAPKGHTAKVQLGGGNATSYKIGVMPEADFAIVQGESKLVDINQDGTVHVTTKQFSTGELAVDGYMSFDGVRQWKLFKQENFEESVEGWCNKTTSSCGGYTLLGGYKNFAGGEVKKTFEGLPAHTSVKLVATFHFIDAWEGEYAYARIDDNYVWTDTYTNEASSQSVNVCGNDKVGEGRFAVPVSVSVPHTSNKVKISFGSTIDQDPADESWGLSHVAVYIK